VTFDDPLERDFARSDPLGFLNRFKDRPLILDPPEVAASAGCGATSR